MKMILNCLLIIIGFAGLIFIEYRRQQPIAQLRSEMELLRIYDSQMAIRTADIEALEYYFSHQRVAVSTVINPIIKKSKLLNRNIDIIITNEKGEPTEMKK